MHNLCPENLKNMEGIKLIQKYLAEVFFESPVTTRILGGGNSETHMDPAKIPTVSLVKALLLEASASIIQSGSKR